MLNTTIKDLGTGFLSLFFPNLCLSCRKTAITSPELICTRCEVKLPETHLHEQKENELTERFIGQLPLKYGAAMFYFSSDGVVRNLVHQLKYANKPQVGEMLGEWYGRQLKNSMFQEIDCIIPIPLHPKKLFRRGYNQSSAIAKGLSRTMQKPLLDDAVIRTINTETQTKKTKLERFENVSKAFKVAKPELLKGKHLLLVDDVITTGATLEGCAMPILEVPNVKISIASIGFTTDWI